MKNIILIFLLFISSAFGGNKLVLVETFSLFAFIQEDTNSKIFSILQDSMPLVKGDGSYCYLSDDIYEKYAKKNTIKYSFPKIPDKECNNFPPYKNIVKSLTVIDFNQKEKIFNEEQNFVGNKITYKISGYPYSNTGICGSVASVQISLEVNGTPFFKECLLEKWCSTNININKIDLNFIHNQVILNLSYANLSEENERFEKIKFIKIPFSYFVKNTISHLTLEDVERFHNEN